MVGLVFQNQGPFESVSPSLQSARPAGKHSAIQVDVGVVVTVSGITEKIAVGCNAALYGVHHHSNIPSIRHTSTASAQSCINAARDRQTACSGFP